MDSNQGPPSKRHKAMPSSSFFRNLPGEVRNQLYELTALPDSVEPKARVLKTVTEDGTIAPLYIVRSCFMDTVSESGRSTLFGIDLVHVTELTQEVLTLVMPQILFTFNTPHSLNVFAETFAAHVSVCNVVPEQHIELNFTEGLRVPRGNSLYALIPILLNVTFI